MGRIEYISEDDATVDLSDFRPSVNQRKCIFTTDFLEFVLNFIFHLLHLQRPMRNQFVIWV